MRRKNAHSVKVDVNMKKKWPSVKLAHICAGGREKKGADRWNYERGMHCKLLFLSICPALRRVYFNYRRSG